MFPDNCQSDQTTPGLSSTSLGVFFANLMRRDQIFKNTSAILSELVKTVPRCVKTEYAGTCL